MIFADRIAVIVRRCIAVWTGSNRDRSGLDVDPAYTDPIRIRCGSFFDVVWKGLQAPQHSLIPHSIDLAPYVHRYCTTAKSGM